MRGITDRETDADWTRLLGQDERIIWEGQPSSRVRLPSSPSEFVLSLFFIGLGLISIQKSTEAWDGFQTLGVLWLGTGLFVLLGSSLWQSFVRRRTKYALSTRRAFIFSRVHGRPEMKTYNISNQTRLLPGPQPGTIVFAEEYLLSQDGVQAVNVGFEAIEDMQEVLQLLRQIQEGLE